jgi:hypothetical protein
MTDTKKEIENNTGSGFVLKSSVPLQFFTDLNEWYDDCKSMHNDNRWKKIWHDHVYTKDLKNHIINIECELKELQSRLRDLFNTIKENKVEDELHRGLLK